MIDKKVFRRGSASEYEGLGSVQISVSGAKG